MKIKVYKIGGNVVDDGAALEIFCKDFAGIEGPKVLIHGGGAVANHIQKALGQEPVKIAGRRVTDAETLKVVTMVYSGLCNKTITALLQKNGCNALGLSGCDANVICASRRAPLVIDGKAVDFGFVGDVTAESVNTPFLINLLEAGIVPVLCAINHDGNGQLLNTNADTMASATAQALAETAEVELVFCFEKPGVLSNVGDDSSVIPHISPSSFARLKAEGTVADGMIPKLENSFRAISAGVGNVVIRSALQLTNNIQTILTDD